MKKLIFTTLKAVEVLVAILVYLLIAFIGYSVLKLCSINDHSMFGLTSFLIGLALFCFAISFIYAVRVVVNIFRYWIDLNRHWTDKIYNRLNK